MNMKTYKAVFSSQSILNDIPNSQTIFGAICTILSETQGEEALSEYIESLNTKEPKFIHSSMYLNGYLPMVKRSVFSLKEVNDLVKKSQNKDKLLVLADTKKYKKLSFMSYEIYKKYISKGKFDELKTDVLTHKDQFSIENGVFRLKDEDSSSLVNSVRLNLTRNGFPKEKDSLEKSLFYTTAQYYKNGTEFVIYIKANVEKEYLENIFKYLEYFGIGNRRTVGNNCFRFERIEDFKFEESKDYKLILSRYIPEDSEADFNSSYYVLTNDIYRASKNYGKGFIDGQYVHVLEGSLMKMNNEEEFYGRIKETDADGKKLYHYGIGFSV